MQQGLVNIGWTAVFQLVNTIIIYLVLKKLLFKPVTNFMENRRKGIENNLKEADLKVKEAEELKMEYMKKLDAIHEERNKIIKEATRRAEERSEEIIKTAKLEAKKEMERASLRIEGERQKAINELKDEISALALMAASKVIEKELDKKAHQDVIKQFIDEVGETKWQS